MIRDLSRLVSSQLCAAKTEKYLCNRCIRYFSTAELNRDHDRNCTQLNTCRVILPNEDESIIEFKNFKHKERVGITIYCDFECFLQRVNNDDRVYQRHIPYSVGMYIHNSYDQTKSEYRSYRQLKAEDETPKKWFIRQLKFVHYDVKKMMKTNKPMTGVQEEAFRNAKICHICEKEFKSDDKRVRDHCHLTSHYR